MIKHIIHCGDIHIKNLRRLDEITEQLEKFLNECRDIVDKKGADSVRIVVAGDVFSQKINISNEAKLVAAWFFRELDSIAKTIVIAGNHDFLMNNKSRVDSLTPIFEMGNYKNVFYADKELGYQSGCIVDDNIVWCLYSSFDDFNAPEDLEYTKSVNPESTFIGLFHGEVNGAKTDAGYMMERGLNGEYFEGMDFVCAGHIHKSQEIKKNGIKIVYSGSLIQQDYGENVTGHGYALWNVEKRTWKHREIENPDHGFFKVIIKDENDINENNETFINL